MVHHQELRDARGPKTQGILPASQRQFRRRNHAARHLRRLFRPVVVLARSAGALLFPGERQIRRRGIIPAAATVGDDASTGYAWDSGRVDESHHTEDDGVQHLEREDGYQGKGKGKGEGTGDEDGWEIAAKASYQYGR